MVGTMTSTNQEVVTTATAVAPPIFPPAGSNNNNNNNNELAALANLDGVQKQIVAGLLRQQPTIIQAAVSGSISPKIEQDIDFATFIQTIQAYQGNQNGSLAGLNTISFHMDSSAPGNTTLITEETRRSASSSPSSPPAAVSNSGVSTGVSTSTTIHEPEYKPRNIREKVYADGYIMSFDKKSCCGTKFFWRCERKNDCNARMHSDIATREIVRKLHPHNHEKPSPEELAFYEQDFSSLDPNYCHPVKSINRSYMQRKLSRASHIVSQTQQNSQLPEPMEIDTNQTIQQLQHNNNLMLFASAVAAAASAGVSPPTGVGQKRISSSVLPIQIKSPRLIKKEEEETFPQTITTEELRTTYEITRKLMKMMKPKTEIGVRWKGDEDALLLFLSNDNGAEENVFLPVVVMNRNEKSLVAALEGFTGKRCEGSIALSYSQRVNVLVHEALICNWTHGKLFLVNSDSMALWRLTPVDAFGDPLNQG
ncbi:hypothetical protein GCK72_009973 [Caenorhabditis remanei]|uniref:FLYWCH-type domain-containing protein n=1 Tax=Caenorhabditis remanei TaxID=31234 RepID=A0A6A5H3D7_CAERE|nr:hypothetical protein GCK72_009973 [Caenorhabditis remanei]KAF1761717.1 hypothetical protein GCK72_009973 [Caenorhabditis remanei]